MNTTIKPLKSKQYLYSSCTVALILCASTNVYATDWALIKKTNDYELLVDMDSYNESAGLPFISAKTVFTNPKNDTINGKNLWYLEEYFTSQFNCKFHTYKPLQSYFYKNKLIASQKGIKLFMPLENGSKHAAVATLACQVHQMVGGM